MASGLSKEWFPLAQMTSEGERPDSQGTNPVGLVVLDTQDSTIP